ncbi:Lrp/AsnC ligand binding domain-containing protein [Bacillus swezeyi]|uniref:Lrp/AsnC ligand binding domain-containing protein n=1 Tax=Bacillus swezeyi TaxID=1925020 RepID=UPI0016537758
MFFEHTNDHSRFLAFTAEHEAIIEAHRISGEGCYILNMNTASGKELNERMKSCIPPTIGPIFRLTK